MISYFGRLGNTTSLTDSHVASLPENLFNDLVDLYRIDFEIFNYRIPKFADYDELRRTDVSS